MPFSEGEGHIKLEKGSLFQEGGVSQMLVKGFISKTYRSLTVPMPYSTVSLFVLFLCMV